MSGLVHSGLGGADPWGEDPPHRLTSQLSMATKSDTGHENDDVSSTATIQSYKPNHIDPPMYFRTSRASTPKSHKPPHRRYWTRGTSSGFLGAGRDQSAAPRLLYSSLRDLGRFQSGFYSLSPNLVPEFPEVMRFETWWTERTGPQRVKIDYFTRDKHCVAHLPARENSRALVQVAVEICSATNAQPVEAWDLHVGAHLRLLNRPITLKKANLQTQMWLDHNAQRLQDERAFLEAELSKFEDITLSRPRYDLRASHVWAPQSHRRPDMRRPQDPKQPAGGRVNLRRLMEDVEELRTRLRRRRHELPDADSTDRPVSVSHVSLEGALGRVPDNWRLEDADGSDTLDGSNGPNSPRSVISPMPGLTDWLDSIPLARSAAKTTIHRTTSWRAS